MLHPGFYKLGYVTTDRDQAVDLLTERLGIEQFVPFEPSFDVVTADGRRGGASLRCAFSAGRDLFIEVLQPVDGPVEVFAEPLAGSRGFALKFHHTAVIVEDLAAVKASAAKLGLAPTRVMVAPVRNGGWRIRLLSAADTTCDGGRARAARGGSAGDSARLRPRRPPARLPEPCDCHRADGDGRPHQHHQRRLGDIRIVEVGHAAGDVHALRQWQRVGQIAGLPARRGWVPAAIRGSVMTTSTQVLKCCETPKL